MSLAMTIIIIIGMLLTFILIAFGINCKKEVELKRLDIYSDDEVDFDELGNDMDWEDYDDGDKYF